MFEIWLDTDILYYPGDPIYSATEAVLKTAIGDAGELNLTIPVTNPRFDDFKERKSIVIVKENDEDIFIGEVREISKTLDLELNVYAVGELAWLADTIQRQACYQDTPENVFAAMLASHNAQVDSSKQFTLGSVTVTDPNNYILRYTNYEDTLSDMREKLCDSLNGYLRVRHVGNTRFLDLVTLEDLGSLSGQKIEFGSNLLDYTDTITTDDIATACIPLGEKLDTSTVSGLDDYLTIKSVNSGSDVLYSQSAIDNFGWIVKAVNFEDVTVASNLKTKGQQWLAANQFANLEIEVTAIDLSVLGNDIDAFHTGDAVNVVCPFYGLDAWYYITEKKEDLLDATKNSITIGSSLSLNYTQSQSKIDAAILAETVQESSILAKAKATATTLITTATSGNIYFINDSNGNPKELCIMDTSDIATATKVWRWNSGGLGYSSTGYSGTYGLAMTINGAIVADYITTGTMYADRIKGGSLTLGGSGNANGQIVVKNASGSTIGTWDNAGVAINSGSITLGSNFSVTSAGTLTAKTGTIAGFTLNNTYNRFEVHYNSILCGYLAGYGASVDAGVTFFGKDAIVIATTDGEIDMYGTSVTMTAEGGGNCAVQIVGSLVVYGTKNRCVETDNNNERLLYCYETTSPMFGDLGEGTTDETGKCVVWLEDVFAETIDTDCVYQVFLQKYGQGDVWVSERNPLFFVVEGTPNISFGWELKAFQKGYDTTRLEEHEQPENNPDILDETYQYLTSLLYDTEDAA